VNSTFFCDLGALTIQQRQRHGELAKRLRPLVVEFEELPNGYAVKLRSVQLVKTDIEEFMTLESLCCPFFTLSLENEIRPENEEQTYVLNITGRGDIKSFIREEFGIPENQNVT
jgi:hypothetical protein